EHSLEESEIRHFFYTDLLSYMHKMKIPQVFTLILKKKYNFLNYPLDYQRIIKAYKAKSDK
ncbi:hypothetical protein, partial [Bacteroides faecis]|uniref:hypothetical protein n=1 Tax=Bacteroides faecis TaxID=674529 RepID=UPI003D9A8BAE